MPAVAELEKVVDEAVSLLGEVCEPTNGLGGAEMSDDAQTHYDLGVAYAELGLVEEALFELELACRKRPAYRDSPEVQAFMERLREGLKKPPNEPLH